MTKFFRFSIAHINIEVMCHERTVFNECKDYLNSFAVPDMTVSASMAEMEAEAQLLPPITESYEGVATTRFYGNIESKIIQQKIADNLPLFDSMVMHGSVIALNNQGHMFTAPSGVGKTTRTRIWLDMYPSSLVVNGDKPIIKITETQAIACGTPWCGKEGWNTNIMVPLKTIFLLERANEEEESSVEEVSISKAFPILLQQTHLPKDLDLMKKTLYLLKSLEGKVKIYKFRSSPTKESVKLAFETAKRDD